MEDGLDYNQVFQLQARENVRAYVRELAGWDKDEAMDAFLIAVRLIDRASTIPSWRATCSPQSPQISTT